MFAAKKDCQTWIGKIVDEGEASVDGRVAGRDQATRASFMSSARASGTTRNRRCVRAEACGNSSALWAIPIEARRWPC